MTTTHCLILFLCSSDHIPTPMTLESTTPLLSPKPLRPKTIALREPGRFRGMYLSTRALLICLRMVFHVTTLCDQVGTIMASTSVMHEEWMILSIFGISELPTFGSIF